MDPGHMYFLFVLLGLCNNIVVFTNHCKVKYLLITKAFPLLEHCLFGLWVRLNLSSAHRSWNHCIEKFASKTSWWYLGSVTLIWCRSTRHSWERDVFIIISGYVLHVLDVNTFAIFDHCRLSWRSHGKPRNLTWQCAPNFTTPRCFWATSFLDLRPFIPFSEIFLVVRDVSRSIGTWTSISIPLHFSTINVSSSMYIVIIDYVVQIKIRTCTCDR